ncbi:unnamed protein product [Penicillium bialowiezense]
MFVRLRVGWTYNTPPGMIGAGVNNAITSPDMIGAGVRQLPTPNTGRIVPADAVQAEISHERGEQDDEEIDDGPEDAEMNDGQDSVDESDPPPSRRLYQCGIAACNDTFLDRAGLERHQTTKHAVVVSCRLCGIDFYDKRRYKEHLSLQHSDCTTEFRCVVPHCTSDLFTLQAIRTRGFTNENAGPNGYGIPVGIYRPDDKAVPVGADRLNIRRIYAVNSTANGNLSWRLININIHGNTPVIRAETTLTPLKTGMQSLNTYPIDCIS